MNANLLFKKKINTESEVYFNFSLKNKVKAIEYMFVNPEIPLGTVAQKLNIHPEYLRAWIKECDSPA